MTLIVLTKILSSYQCRISTHQCVFSCSFFALLAGKPRTILRWFSRWIILGPYHCTWSKIFRKLCAASKCMISTYVLRPRTLESRKLKPLSRPMSLSTSLVVYDFTPVLVGIFFFWGGGVMAWFVKTCLICFSIFVGVGWWQDVRNMQKSKYMNIYNLYMWTWQIFISCTYWLDILMPLKQVVEWSAFK